MYVSACWLLRTKDFMLAFKFGQLDHPFIFKFLFQIRNLKMSIKEVYSCHCMYKCNLNSFLIKVLDPAQKKNKTDPLSFLDFKH